MSPRIGEVTLADIDAARGVVIVIDVLRAFTTAAIAIDRGAVAVRCVATVEEALAARAGRPDVLLVGEVDGRPVDGFDLSNSPTAMRTADVEGRLLVHRSTAGTQGVVRAAPHADALYAASFANAAATARAVTAHAPQDVTFVLTGVDTRDGDEDRACGEYIAALLRDEDPVPTTYLERIATSDAGRRFLDGDPDFPASDLEEAARLDVVGLALRAIVEDGAPTLRRQELSRVAGAAGAARPPASRPHRDRPR